MKRCAENGASFVLLVLVEVGEALLLGFVLYAIIYLRRELCLVKKEASESGDGPGMPA